MDDLGNEGECDHELVGQRFGVAPAMTAEIMYLNDEYAVDCWTWVDVVISGPMPQYREIQRPWGLKTERVHESHERSVRAHNDDHPQQRWQRMRQWAVENLKTPAAQSRADRGTR